MFSTYAENIICRVMLFSFRPTTLRTEEEEGDFARGRLSLPELSRKIEEDSARRVSPY